MRRVVIVVAVLAALLVVGDRAACWLAQRGLAEAIQRSQGLATPPEVAIRGIPFLTQAFSGRYQQVDVRLQDLTARNGVRVDVLAARLTGVHLPLADAVGGNVQEVPVDHVAATAQVGFAALDAAAAEQIPTDQLTVHFGAAPGGALAVTGTLTTPLGDVTVQGQARLAISGDGLVVSVQPDSLTGLPAAARAEVARLLTARLDLPGLPLGFRPTGVQVSDAGVAVTAQANGVVITPNGTRTAERDLSGTDSTLAVLAQVKALPG